MIRSRYPSADNSLHERHPSPARHQRRRPVAAPNWPDFLPRPGLWLMSKSALPLHNDEDDGRLAPAQIASDKWRDWARRATNLHYHLAGQKRQAPGVGAPHKMMEASWRVGKLASWRRKRPDWRRPDERRRNVSRWRERPFRAGFRSVDVPAAGARGHILFPAGSDLFARACCFALVTM